MHHTIERLLSKWWDYKVCLNCGSWNWYENKECVNCQGDQFRKASRKDAEKLNDTMADVDIFSIEMDV
jgi:ribosomal protein L40E